MSNDKAIPWKICAVKGGWDGICDAEGRELYRLSLNDPKLIPLTVKAVNLFDELVGAVERSIQFYKEEIDAIGPCDHAVGICGCGVFRDLQILEEILAKAKEPL